MFDKTGNEQNHWLMRDKPLDLIPPAQTLSTDEVFVEEEHIRYGYHVGELNLLIEADVSSELIKTPALYSVPGSPAWYLGIINLRGNLVSILDINNVLNGTVSQAPSVDVLVLEKNENAVGVAIDGLPKTVRISGDGVSVAELPEILTQYVRNAYVVEDNMWLEVDHKGLLKHWLTQFKN